MGRVYAEAVPTPGNEMPFKVVVSYDTGDIIDEIAVRSQEEGEELIKELLSGLRDLAKKGGYI